MCRLMGYVSAQDHSIAEFAGPHFNDFVELSSFHKDGWGVAELESGSTTPTLTLEPIQANTSETFKKVASTHKSDGAILHFRWATAGLPIVEGNTHPFTHGEISFMHNGGVIPANSMDSFIDADLFAGLRGTTDSERYFATILTEIRKHGLTDGIISAVRKIRDTCDYSSLNSMILTPHQLIVVNEHNFKRIPAGETEEYYALYYRKDANGVMVASSGWDQSGWKLINNHRVLVIDRTTFEIEEFEL